MIFFVVDFFDFFFDFCFLIFLDFFLGGGFFSKLLRLLLKVTKVTTGHQKSPKMGQNRIISRKVGRKGERKREEGKRRKGDGVCIRH